MSEDNGSAPAATPYRVLYAEVGGLDRWLVARNPDDPLGMWTASSADNAIGMVRTADPDLKDHDLAFVAIPPRSWNPKAMEKELVERWSLKPLDEAAPRQEALA